MELGEHGKFTFLGTGIRKCHATGRAFKLSSTWHLFQMECDLFTQTFSRLQYPAQLLQSTISNCITKCGVNPENSPDDENGETKANNNTETNNN